MRVGSQAWKKLTLGPADRQPSRPRDDADGRRHPRRRGVPDARPLPSRRAARSSTPPTRTATDLRGGAGAVAGPPPRRGGRGDEGALLGRPTRAARASRPTASARPATPACAASASTRSTSTRSTRPTRACRSRRRWRRSTGSCRRARCARSARRTTRPGCSPGRSALQDRNGWSPFVSLQPQYSLVERSIEVELLPFCRAAGLGVLPWGPLGAGFLSGRYSRDEAPPEGSRMAAAADDLEEARTAARSSATSGRRRGRGDRRRPRRDRAAGRDRVAARRRGRDGADRRPAHARASRGPARRRRR